MRADDIWLERCGSAALWDRLAREQPGGTAFHRWDFLDLQERVLGVRFERLLAIRDGLPVGVVPLARRSGRSPRAPWLPFPMLGPALPERAMEPTLRAVRRYQRAHALVLARFDVAPGLVEAAQRAAPAAGMRVRADGTVRIDLSHGSVEQLDARMGRTRRKQVRQAQRAGVLGRAAEPGEAGELLSRVLAEAYRGRGAANPYPDDVGETVAAWAQGRADVRVGVVLVEDRPVGALVSLGGHPVAEGWIGAVLPEARALHAESVLLRDGMAWAMAAGSATWDFGGRVDDEVERYKCSFGGEPEPYCTVESFLGPFAVREALGRR